MTVADIPRETAPIVELARRLLAFEGLTTGERAALERHAQPVADHADGRSRLTEADYAIRATRLIRWAMSNGFALDLLELQLELEQIHGISS